MTRRWLPIVATALCAIPRPGNSIESSGAPMQAPAATVQLLAINDFHGHLEPPDGANGRIGRTAAGGSEYLATHLARAAAQNPNSIVVAAGDLVGASPLLSALFHDEPTIESMNAMHLAVASVGNHEFDEGSRELLRLQNGGCHPVDGCQDRDGFGGAAFTYLAANVIQAGGAPILPPTAVRTLGGVKVGFIGLTLRGTPRIVTPAGVRGLEFLDEATTANRHAAELKGQGVHAIVLLIHQGGTQAGAGDPNGCAGFTGGLTPILNRLSPDIKVVISGHTHQAYTCTVGGRSVTSAGSFGRMITRVTLTIDPASGAIAAAKALNEVVTRDVPKEAAQTRIIAKYAPLSAPIASRVVGSVRTALTRRANDAGESALGDVIADAHLAATSAPEKGGAVVAFTNTGGIRADIVPAASARTITYGDLFGVQPFGNVLTVVTLTGDALKRLLEQQFNGARGGSASLLQVSSGFTYSYTLRAPAGRHVDPASMRLDGRVIAPTDQIRVAANNFLIEGGDGFTVFREGTNQLGGDVDVDALVAYFLRRSPVQAGPLNRIVRMPGS